MKERCNNPNSHAYLDYGKRGIKVCDRWNNSFEHFYEDMGKRPSKDYWLERVDNSKGYSPDNCIWLHRIEQQNNKRNNTPITINGVTKTSSQWSRETGLSRNLIRARIRQGLTGLDIIQPKRSNGRKSKVTKTLFPFTKYLFSPTYPLENYHK